MNSPEDDFKDVRRLLALKKHEEPPPGYFTWLPEKIAVKIDRHSDLSEHSTWWEWMVEKFDARPFLAGLYACGISSLMLLGFKISQELQNDPSLENAVSSGLMGATPDPISLTPGAALQSHFANPAELINFSSMEAFVDEPAPAVSYTTFSRPRGH